MLFDNVERSSVNGRFLSLSVSNTTVCSVAGMTSKDYSGRCETTELPRWDNDDCD